MAQVIGGISVYLEDDTARFQQGMRASATLVEQQSQRMSRAIGGAAKSVDELQRKSGNFQADAFRGLAISALRAESSVKRLELGVFAVGAALGGGFLGTAAVRALQQYADEFTNIRNRIASVVADRKEQVGVENELFKIAERSRSSIESTTTLYARIRAAAPQLAQNSGELLRLIETVQKSFIVGGASTQEAQASALQLSQALGSGRLQGDELRSILENNIPLARTLANALAGGDIGALKGLGTEGALTTEKVIQAILAGTKDIDEAFARTTPRVADAFIQLNNAAIRYVGTQDQALGASAALARGLVSIAENFHTVADAAALAGAAIAGAFVFRTIGTRVQNVAGALAAEKTAALARATAAEDAYEAAVQARREAFNRKEQAAAAVEQFQQRPTFEQAPVSLQNKYTTAAANVDAARAALQKATDKEAAILAQIGDIESATAAKSAAAVKAQTAAVNGLTVAEQRLAAAGERVAAAQAKFDAAGGTVRKSELQKFYTALANEAEARSNLATTQAAQVVNQSNIQALQKAEVVARSKKDFEALQAIRSRLEDEIGRIDQLANQRVLQGNALNKAEAASAAASAAIDARQLSEKEQLAVRLARASDDYVKQEQAVLAARANVQAKSQAVADSEVRSEDSRQKQLTKLYKQGADARTATIKASTNLLANQNTLQAIGASIPTAALQDLDKLKGQAVVTSVQYGQALQAETLAQRASEAATRSLSGARTVATVALRGLQALGTSLVAFLGGPWGVAFAAAGAALGIYEVMSAKAAARTEEFKKTLDGVPEQIKRIADAQKSGPLAAGLIADANITGKKLEDGLKETMAGLKKQIFDSQNSLFRGGSGEIGAFLAFQKAASSLTTLNDGSLAADKNLTEFAKTIDELSAKDINVANKLKPLRDLAQQAIETNARVRDAQAGLSVVIQDPRDLRAAASAARLRAAEQAITASAIGANPASANPDANLNDPVLNTIRARGKLARDVEAAEGDQTIAAIEAKTKEIYDALNKDPEQGGISLAEARAAAAREVIAKSIQSLDVSSIVDKATEAIKNLHDATDDGISQNFNTRLAEASVLMGQVTPVARNTAAVLNEVFGVIGQQIGSGNAEASATLDRLKSSLQDMTKTGEFTQDRVNELVRSLNALAAANPDLSPAIAEALRLAGALSTATQQAGLLKAAISGAGTSPGNLASQRRLLENADAPGVNEAFDKFQMEKNKQTLQVQTQLEAARLKKAGDITGAKLVELRQQFPNVGEEALRLLAQETAKAAKGSKAKKSDEAKFQEKLERFTETGKAAFFTDSDRALIDKLEQLKAKPEIIAQTAAAIQNNTPLPAQAQAARDSIELKKAGDAYRELIQKYGTIDQLAPQIAEKQRILNLAVQQGGLTAEQARQGFADYLTGFQQFHWIDDVANAFGNAANELASGSAKIKDVFKSLITDLNKIMIQQFIVNPIKTQISQLLAGGFGAQLGSSGGSGIFGSLLGGIFGLFGGGGSSLYATTSAAAVKFHGGGRVGAGGSKTSVPLSSLMGPVPRFHSGLRSDELLSVLQKGEDVLTKTDSARMARTMSGLADRAVQDGSGAKGDTIIQIDARGAQQGVAEQIAQALRQYDSKAESRRQEREARFG